VLRAASSLREFKQALMDHSQSQRLLPVVDEAGILVGVVTRGDLHKRMNEEGEAALRRTLCELVHEETVEVFPDEPLRSVVYRMAENQVTRVPVIEPDTRKFLGLVALEDLLKARARHLEEEKRRERVLDLRFFLPGGGAQEREQAPEQTETAATP
jgi:CIC family chloride channel protein